MRTFGRSTTTGKWVEIDTDTNGFDDPVWITTLAQCIKLQIGESPFFANYGIPVQQTIVTQVNPDFYVSQLQSQFAQFFSSLQVAKVSGASVPTYSINLITNQGAKVQTQIAV